MRAAFRCFPPDDGARRKFDHFAAALGFSSEGRMVQEAVDDPRGFNFDRVDDHEAVVSVAKTLPKEV